VATYVILRKFRKNYRNEPSTKDQHDAVNVDVNYSGALTYFAIRGFAEQGGEIGTSYLWLKLRDAAGAARH